MTPETQHLAENFLPPNYEFLSPETTDELISFLKRQFTGDPIDWFDYDELKIRLTPRQGIKKEIIGIIEREDGKIIGAAISYRAPFSHDLWVLPAIAIEKGDALIPSFQRKGHGKKLMSLMLEAIKLEGGKAVLTDTNKLPERGGSGPFLEKCGFKFIGKVFRYFDGRHGEIGIIFVKHINP